MKKIRYKNVYRVKYDRIKEKEDGREDGQGTSNRKQKMQEGEKGENTNDACKKLYKIMAFKEYILPGVFFATLI